MDSRALTKDTGAASSNKSVTSSFLTARLFVWYMLTAMTQTSRHLVFLSVSFRSRSSDAI